MRKWIQLRKTKDPDLFEVVAPVDRDDDETPVFGRVDTEVIEGVYPGSGKLYRNSTGGFEDDPNRPKAIMLDSRTDVKENVMFVSVGTLQTDIGKMMAKILENQGIEVEEK